MVGDKLFNQYYERYKNATKEAEREKWLGNLAVLVVGDLWEKLRGVQNAKPKTNFTWDEIQDALFSLTGSKEKIRKILRFASTEKRNKIEFQEDKNGKCTIVFLDKNK